MSVILRALSRVAPRSASANVQHQLFSTTSATPTAEDKPLKMTWKYGEGLRKYLFKSMAYNQYGLYHNDLYNDDEYGEPEVIEAVKRLPPNLLDERNYRLQRAMQLELLKTKLPKEEWPTFEENQEKGYYLEPYIHEVRKEMKEQKDWFTRAK